MISTVSWGKKIVPPGAGAGAEAGVAAATGALAAAALCVGKKTHMSAHY